MEQDGLFCSPDPSDVAITAFASCALRGTLWGVSWRDARSLGSFRERGYPESITKNAAFHAVIPAKAGIQRHSQRVAESRSELRPAPGPKIKQPLTFRERCI